jgi:hypothetical protein
MASSNDPSWVLSWRWPAVTRTASGRPWPSQARWILVVSPPRLRPSAWSASAADPRYWPVPLFGHRRRAGGLARSWRPPPPPSRPPRPHRSGSGRGRGAVARCRRPASGGTAHSRSAKGHSAQAGPARHPGGQLPQNPVHHPAVVGPLATGTATCRQQGGDLGPGLVGELVAPDHATSHIKKLTATRPYNTSRQTGPSHGGPGHDRDQARPDPQHTP